MPALHLPRLQDFVAGKSLSLWIMRAQYVFATATTLNNIRRHTEIFKVGFANSLFISASERSVVHINNCSSFFRPRIAYYIRSLVSNMAKMRAIMIRRGGGPGVFEIGACAKPDPCVGFVLIRVKAFGINQGELLIRRCYNPIGLHPRILGLEAVGEVVAAPGGEFPEGSIVATALGFLLAQQMGSYAQYISVPASQVLPLRTKLDWSSLGAMPLMMLAAYNSLFKVLCVKRGETLLIRGGTTSVGLAATAIATSNGVHVTGTTRNMNHMQRMMSFGAREALLDRGLIAPTLSEKFDKVLELIGTTTLPDSLHCVKRDGVVCVAGMVGGSWPANFDLTIHVPNYVSLMIYTSSSDEFMQLNLQLLVDSVEAHELKLPIAKVFRFEEIAEAHHYMEESRGMGKIVVTL